MNKIFTAFLFWGLCLNCCREFCASAFLIHAEYGADCSFRSQNIDTFLEVRMLPMYTDMWFRVLVKRKT